MKDSSIVSRWRLVLPIAAIWAASLSILCPQSDAAPVAPQDQNAPEQTSETEAGADASTSSDSSSEQDENVAAIWSAIDSYVNAFNQGDAEALASHFAEGGELVTPSGTKMAGRDELQTGFATFFKETPNAKLELSGTRVEQISPRVAIETGVARVIVADGEPSETLYETIHIKTESGWKIDRSRDEEGTSPEFSNHEMLTDLEWLIGTWIDEGSESTVRTAGRWSKNGNFIIRSFSVVSGAGTDFEGTQIIGWDPAAETIRSWTFDSDGGFAVGRWSVSGDRWKVQNLNILSDGRRGSSINIYQPIGENSIEFSSTARQVDGELLPSIRPVRVVRATK